MRRHGIDIGSVYLSAAEIAEGRVVATTRREHRGDLRGAVEQLRAELELGPDDRIGVTGSVLGSMQGTIDNLLAVVEGARLLLPGCRNVLVVGGQSFSLVLYDSDGRYREHSVNPPCAAGTGSFIDQQADRLDLGVAELARRAGAHRGQVPTIATRCAVFAKSDVIHSMQEGHSLDSVCAGLCEGVARTLVETLVKGRLLEPPVGMLGGVSLNARIVRAVERGLGLPVQVPEHAAAVGAVGAALMATAGRIELDSLFPALEGSRTVRAPLRRGHRPALAPEVLTFTDPAGNEVTVPPRAPSIDEGVYLGLDIGSTSTKALLLTASGEVVAGFYTSTRGDPTGAVGRLAQSIADRFAGSFVPLRGVATTGSGRKMIRQLFNADCDLDEITAHARAALFLTPEVDTIIEIGGQDSKFTRLRNGEVYYSMMNYVCAAGTGSFIEEQARRLGLDLASFAARAFDQSPPYTSDRCTVYMERDLAALLGEGWSKGALASAVLFSVRDNYLAKVVGNSSVGEHLVFQGATARNPALVAAFEARLGQPIHVSPYCHLTGALGAALHCRDLGLTQSSFALDRLQQIPLAGETCALCANGCLLTVARAPGGTTAWGMRCGRDYADTRKPAERPTAPERRYRQAVRPLLSDPGDGRRGTVRIGLPKALYHIDYHPLWRAFLSKLGFRVVSAAPSRQALAAGKAIVNSDFCAPVILAHGAVADLLRRKVDFLFLPAVVNEPDDRGPIEPLFCKKERDTYYCFVSQYLPSILGSLTSFDLKQRLVSPVLRPGEQSPAQMGAVLAEEMKHLVEDPDEVQCAFAAAHREFRNALTAWSRPAAAFRESDRLQVVLLGRPYTLLSAAANLGIPRRLEAMGVDILFQDELDLDGFDAGFAQPLVETMHWHYGKQILRVAEWVARSRSYFPVVLTCFRCSQDAFLVDYVKEIMAHHDKPFLVLQLDEHASEVGYTTRLEAALRSFDRAFRAPARAATPTVPARPRTTSVGRDETVLIPNIGSLIGAFWREAIEGAGYSAVVLETGTEALATGSQYAHGGECLPVVAVAGGAIRKLQEGVIDPAKAHLYLPTVCMACNFPQFPVLAQSMLAAAGFGAVRSLVFNSMAPTSLSFWPVTLNVRVLEAGIAACQLQKLYHRVVPYESVSGEADRALAQAAGVLGRAIREGNAREGLRQATALFAAVERDERGGRKPRIGLLGDYYVKYNDVVNQNVCRVVQGLGCELIFPSISENSAHFHETDIRLQGASPSALRMLRRFEQRLEVFSSTLIGDQTEPEWADCSAAMERWGLRHHLPGETTLNLGRALYYLERHRVDAVLHVNPIFCGPGVVSASIFRKMQADFGVPIIDIFYDGSGDPNRVLIPHLHYLKARLAS